MWPLIVLAASAVAKAQNNRMAQKRQQDLANAMGQYQKSRAREQEGAINELLEQQSPDKREAAMVKAVQDREAEMRKDVAGTTPAAPQTAAPVAPERAAAEERSANMVSERTRRAIEQMARMGAPGVVQQDFSRRFARKAGVVDAARQASSNVGAAYQTDIANEKPNPWIDTLATIGMAYGAGSMMQGAGGTPAPTPSEWGSIDAGPGADPAFARLAPKPKLANAFSLWGRN